MGELSPMMKQYKRIKNEYPDKILMFRLGDFYEMFFEDAQTVSRELDLTLTGRACGNGERAPMCGVPYHAVQTYITRLLKKGYKIAICEQMQDPSQAKGMIDRSVTRIITGGTITDPESLGADKNNYLMSLYLDESGVGAVWADITTSETYNHFIPYPIRVKLNDLLLRIKQAEIICNSKMLGESVELSAVKFGSVCRLTQYDDDKFDFEIAKRTLSEVLSAGEIKNLCKTPCCVCAEGALISYVQSLQFRKEVNVSNGEAYESIAYMDIDASSARTLELTESQSRKRGTTLRDVLNKTCTAMGDRQLTKWITRPLCVKSTIDERLAAVDELFRDSISRERLRAALSSIKDIVRISASLAIGEVKQKDVLALGVSLCAVPDVKCALDGFSSKLLAELDSGICDLVEARELISAAVNRPTGDKTKDDVTYVIKQGYDPLLDEYRGLVKNSRAVIAQMESEEKEKTGIRNLRISYNRLFGYFIEVPRQFDSQVPDYYVRRQTVANAERYTTEALKELEYKVINSADLADKREHELYLAVLEKLRAYCGQINENGKNIATLDCLVSLATVAKSNG